MDMRIVRRDMSSHSTERIALSDLFVIHKLLLVPIVKLHFCGLPSQISPYY